MPLQLLKELAEGRIADVVDVAVLVHTAKTSAPPPRQNKLLHRLYLPVATRSDLSSVEGREEEACWLEAEDRSRKYQRTQRRQEEEGVRWRLEEGRKEDSAREAMEGGR
eukprot:767760-Hanusia_phi.AAC.2